MQKKAQNQKRKLEQEQVRLQQDKLSTTQQIDECAKEIKSLKNDVVNSLTKWRELYEGTDISREWIIDRIEAADITIEKLNTTRDAYNKAITDLNEVDRKHTICENNHANQSSLLKDTKQELDELSEEIEGLKADIDSTETNFWESIPYTFHTDTTKQALSDFSEMIENVSSYEQTLHTNNSQFEVLNTKIENNRNNLEGLEKQRTELKTEIEQYQNEGGKYLNLVRKHTDGLETGRSDQRCYNET